MSETFRSCPVCGAASVVLAHQGRFAILRCTGCGVEYTDPMPDPDELARFYADYRDFRADPEVVQRNAERQLALLRREPGITQSDRILDFGCGQNRFVQVCRAAGYAAAFGYDPFVMEPEDPCRIADPGAAAWRLVTLWGVLEHLTDPGDTLRTLARQQPSGSWLALTTIDRESAIPCQYKPPEHLWYFTREALGRLADSAGYRLERYEPYRMEQLADVYLQILLRTVPEAYRAHIHHELPRLVEVPTNEALVLLRRSNSSDQP